MQCCNQTFPDLERRGREKIHDKRVQGKILNTTQSCQFSDSCVNVTQCRPMELTKKNHMSLFSTGASYVFEHEFFLKICIFIESSPFPEFLNNPVLVTKAVQSGMPYRDTKNPVHHQPHSHLARLDRGRVRSTTHG